MRFGVLAGIVFSCAYGQTTCIPFPFGFVAFSSIISVTAADSAGEKRRFGPRPFVRHAIESTVTVRWNFLGERDGIMQNETGRGSGGGLCWRATRQGILCRKLIPMSPGRASARPAVLNESQHRNRFPHALRNSMSLASTLDPIHVAARTRLASGTPGPNAVASHCRSDR